MKVKISYEQHFNGEKLSDSYERTVADSREAVECVNRLYEDPHVGYATFEIMEES